MTTITNVSGQLGTIPIVEAFLGSGSFEQLIVIKAASLPSSRVRIRGTVAGATLTGLRVTKAIIAGGTHVPYLVDADLDLPFSLLPWTSKTPAGPSLYLTPAGSAFEFHIDMQGLAEIAIWTKSAGAGSVTFEVGQ